MFYFAPFTSGNQLTYETGTKHYRKATVTVCAHTCAHVHVWVGNADSESISETPGFLIALHRVNE